MREYRTTNKDLHSLQGRREILVHVLPSGDLAIHAYGESVGIGTQSEGEPDGTRNAPEPDATSWIDVYLIPETPEELQSFLQKAALEAKPCPVPPWARPEVARIVRKIKHSIDPKLTSLTLEDLFT